MDEETQSQQIASLRELVDEARLVENETWSAYAQLRGANAPGSQVLDALRMLERATANRVRLQHELEAAEK